MRVHNYHCQMDEQIRAKEDDVSSCRQMAVCMTSPFFIARAAIHRHVGMQSQGIKYPWPKFDLGYYWTAWQAIFPSHHGRHSSTMSRLALTDMPTCSCKGAKRLCLPKRDSFRDPLRASGQLARPHCLSWHNLPQRRMRQLPCLNRQRALAPACLCPTSRRS